MISNKTLLMPVIIFDCDGVIFDSNELKTEAFEIVLRNHGLPGGVIDEFVNYHRRNGGVSRYIKFKYLYTDILNQPLTERRVDDLLRAFSSACIDLYSKANLTPGCIEVLEELSQKHNLYVASGSDQKELQEVFRKRNIDQYFKAIFGSPKTKTECVSAIVNKIGSKSKCIMVGDALSDWQAANTSNIDFIYMRTFSDNPIAMASLAVNENLPIIDDLQQLGVLL